MRYIYFGAALLACLPATETQAALAVPGALFPTDVCTSFYPSTLTAAHVAGQVLLTYEIALDGSTHNILVTTSSGNADLDEAARQCVGSLHFRTSRATFWRGHIVWAFGPKGLLSSFDVPHSCDSYYPAAEFKQGVTGKTMLAFTVETDGYVDNVKVATSSGNANLDAAAVTCARRWHYRPAAEDGKPIAASWQTAVDWQASSPPPK